MLWGNNKKIFSNKLIIFVLIFIFVFSFFAPTTEVFAQGLGVGADPNGADQDASASSIDSATGEETQGASAEPQQGADSVPFWDIAGGVKQGVNRAIAGMAYSVLWFTSKLLSAAGILLNITVTITISQMGNIVNNSDAIKAGWTILRDFINILFIFGLLYISIITILKGWAESGARKMLGQIIFAAFLINFSFFFTSVLIDISNLLTVKIYEQMHNCQPTSGTDKVTNLIDTTIQRVDGGITNCFMNALGLQSLHDLTRDGSAVVNNTVTSGDLRAVLISMLFGTLFIMITATIFLAATFMLLSRFISLIILLITSPTMFLGMILPNFKGVSSGWFSKLTSNLVFAPVLFLFFFITYIMLVETDLINYAEIVGTSENAGGSKATLGDFVLKTTNALGLGGVLNYVIVIGFIIASLIVSKKAGDSAARHAGNIVFNTTAALGRRTIGRGARWIANQEQLKEQASKRTVGGFFARRIADVANRTSKSSLDLRAAPGVAQALRAAREDTGVDFGEAQKGGYAQTLKDLEKKYEEKADRYKAKVDEKELDRIEEEKKEEIRNSEEYKEGLGKDLAEKERRESELKDTIDYNRAQLIQAQKEGDTANIEWFTTAIKTARDLLRPVQAELKSLREREKSLLSREAKKARAESGTPHLDVYQPFKIEQVFRPASSDARVSSVQTIRKKYNKSDEKKEGDS